MPSEQSISPPLIQFDEKPKEKGFSVVEHVADGSHLFGEALGLPSFVNDIRGSVLSGNVGVSDNPAREDHTHGYKASLSTAVARQSAALSISSDSRSVPGLLLDYTPELSGLYVIHLFIGGIHCTRGSRNPPPCRFYIENVNPEIGQIASCFLTIPLGTYTSVHLPGFARLEAEENVKIRAGVETNEHKDILFLANDNSNFLTIGKAA